MANPDKKIVRAHLKKQAWGCRHGSSGRLPAQLAKNQALKQQKTKLGVVGLAYNPTYSGVGGRRIVV
jgi:hypothetical protein